MAGQPTPPGPRTPPNNKALLRAYKNRCFPSIRPAIKPLFLGGLRWGGVGRRSP